MNDKQKLEEDGMVIAMLEVDLIEANEELKRLQSIQQGIEWIKYDRNSRSIESHVNHVISDGRSVRVAQHAKNLKSEGYGWHEGKKPFMLRIGQRSISL
jgi:hypothetical protein